MQTLIARQDLVNMIFNQCHLEQGWNVKISNLKQNFVFFIKIILGN